MRRTLALASVLLASQWACLSGKSAPPPTEAAPSNDGSPEVARGVDAAREAAPQEIDATLEAAPPVVDAEASVDGDVTTVTVTVIGAGGYEQGVTIVWGDSTGSVVDTSTTNARGTATHAADAGDMVTALMGSAAAPALTTIMAIEPGDDLVLLDWSTSPAEMNVQVTAFAPSPPAGTTGYQVWGAISPTPPPPVDFSVAPSLGIFGSTVGSSYAALLSALHVCGTVGCSDSQEIGFVFTKDLAVSNLSNQAEAGTLDIAFSGPWSTSFTTQQLVVLGSGGSTSPGSRYAEVASGIEFPSKGQTHVGFADFVQGWAYASTNDLTGELEIAVRQPAPTTDGSMTIDWGDVSAMPAIVGVTADTTNPAQPAFSASTSAGSLASTTGVLALVTWVGENDAGGVVGGSWTVVSPGTAGSIQAPQLPAGSAWAPTSVALVAPYPVVASVYALEGSALPAYAQVRAAAGIFQLPSGGCLFGGNLPPLPADGTLLLSAFTTYACSQQ